MSVHVVVRSAVVRKISRRRQRPDKKKRYITNLEMGRNMFKKAWIRQARFLGQGLVSKSSNVNCESPG